mmetsp:Transcript_41551/g.89221  ORF Transcript_41551/g.89221 Transcript_41551/m.89221 type:complete len:250 (-) Transcript_41551:1930-2679(-)
MLARRGEGARVDVVPARGSRKVDGCRLLLRHWLPDAVDQKNIAEHDLVFDSLLVGMRLWIGQEVPEQWPHDRLAQSVVLLEDCIPKRQQLVPQLQGGLDCHESVFVVHPRFSAWRLQVSMIPEEGVGQDSELVPSNDHLRVRMLEKSSNIGTHQRLPSQGQGTDHGNRCAQVFPLRIIVSSPNGGVLVRPDEEGAGQNKRAVARDPLLEAFEGCSVDVVAVHVMHIPVLDIAVGMDGISWAGDLRTVED